MGSNQSSEQDGQHDRENIHGITVVNPTPDQKASEDKIILPAEVLPILSIDGHNIDSNRHKPSVQLDHRLWIEFAATIDKFSNSRAELVATRQSQLQENINTVDDHVQRFTDSYINDKHKALARMNDDCRKVDDIKKLLEKCTIQSELCVDMLNKLNFLLPPERKLEPLDVLELPQQEISGVL